MPLRRPQQLANPSPSSNLAAAPASRMAEPPSAARCSTRGRHLCPWQPIAYAVAAPPATVTATLFLPPP